MTSMHVISDGEGGSTHLILPSGEEIRGVVEATVTMRAKEVNQLTMVLVPVSVDVEASVASVHFACPCCEKAFTHKCELPDDD